MPELKVSRGNQISLLNLIEASKKRMKALTSMDYMMALLSPAIRAMYINVSSLQSHKYIDRKRVI